MRIKTELDRQLERRRAWSLTLAFLLVAVVSAWAGYVVGKWWWLFQR